MTRGRRKRNDDSVAGLFRAIGEIDVPTVMQRGGALLRILRGDPPEAVAAEHEYEVDRGLRLLKTSTDAMRGVAGCTRRAGCLCPVCAFAPIRDQPTH
jgi:hypothetical protein